MHIQITIYISNRIHISNCACKCIHWSEDNVKVETLLYSLLIVHGDRQQSPWRNETTLVLVLGLCPYSPLCDYSHFHTIWRAIWYAATAVQTCRRCNGKCRKGECNTLRRPFIGLSHWEDWSFPTRMRFDCLAKLLLMVWSAQILWSLRIFVAKGPNCR